MAVSSARPSRELTILLTLAAVQFTHILDFMILMPLGAGLMRVFSINATQFSQLVAAYAFAGAFAGLSAGFFLDRFDRKRALLVLYAGFGLATLACALAPTYSLLLLARLAAGAFGGVAGALVVAMIGDVIPPARRGRAMGLVMSAFPLASIAGVPLGLYLAGRFDWSAPFYLLAFLAIPVFFLAAFALPSLPPFPQTESPLRKMRSLLAQPSHRQAFWVSASLVFGGGLVIPFMSPALVANGGITEARLPLIYLFGGAATLLSTNIIGRLSDRLDKFRVLAAVSTGTVFVVLVLTNLPSVPLPVLLLVTTLFFVTMSGRFAPAMALVINSVGPHHRGGFMGVNSALQQAASGSATLLAGLIITTEPSSGRLLNYPIVGVLAAACFLSTVFLAHRLRRLGPAPGAHDERFPIAEPVSQP